MKKLIKQVSGQLKFYYQAPLADVKFQTKLKKYPMKKSIALSLMLLSSSVFADPAIFGMEIGKMTESELQSTYNVNFLGINKYSHGNMYTIPAASINFEGVKEVTTIFSEDGKLLAVISSLPKNKFDYIKGILDGKYKLVSQEIPFVGNKRVTYREGTTEISLDAPHLSFDMSMEYIHDDFMRAFNRQSQAEARQRQQNEASQL